MGCVMESYKIRVNNEAESKEAQELFVQLGYKLDSFFGKYEATTKWVLAFADGSMGCASEALVEALREITFPQLRDLVVLKRNDVKDATHEDQYGDKWLYLDERHYVYLNDQWDLPTGEFLERYELKPILPVKKQDPSLISGDEALRALADGKEVEFKHDTQGWVPCLGLNIERVLGGWHQMRLKPQTIKLELEFPKPFEPKVGEIYWYLTTSNSKGYDWNQFQSVMGDEFYCQFGAWRTEAEAKQVVEQLRKIKGAV